MALLLLLAAAALQTLVDFLATNAAAASCSGKTVTIVGQAFQHVDAYASVLKVRNALKASCSCTWLLNKKMTAVHVTHCVTALACLQFAAQKGIHISFVAIAYSQVDGKPPMTEVDLADFTTGLADFENASASYCPCGKCLCR